MIRLTNGFCDGMMKHEEALQFVEDNGRDEFLYLLQENFPNKALYAFSTDWEWNDQFILKSRGKRGDVIIGWEGKDYS